MLRVDILRFTPQRRGRLGLWTLFALLPVVGLLLGLFVPQSNAMIEIGGGRGEPLDDAAAPLLLAGEYQDTRTTLWLVAANDPTGARQRLADIPHAWSWDIEAAIAPDQRAAAALIIPPGGWNPQRHAALLRIDASTTTQLATGLDLRGGVIWSDDGARIAARRGGAIVVFDASDGTSRTALTAKGAQSLHPVALRERALWVASIDAAGSHLLQLDLADRIDAAGEANPIARRMQISESATREWTISPDGSRLAFTDLRGSRLSVRVIMIDPIGAAQVDRASTRSTHWSGDAAPDSSAPLWRSDGGLEIGSWRGAASQGGFSLPLAWSNGGRDGDAWLALRSFSGSGPGDAGEERLALRGPNGIERLAPRGFAFIGWWNK